MNDTLSNQESPTTPDGEQVGQHPLVRLCEFVIIVGGPATGKTINKEALQKHFRCEECYDCPGEEFALRQSKAQRVLILTWDADVKDPRHKGKRKPRMEGLRVTIEEARRALGAAWIEPNDQAESRQPRANAD